MDIRFTVTLKFCIVRIIILRECAECERKYLIAFDKVAE